MRILELTNYTAGGCGVGARVKQEAVLLAQKGHTVAIFSSCMTKGSSDIAPPEDTIGGVPITRFPARKLGGESYLTWSFEAKARAFKPDVIIAHAYRHPHTTKALDIGKELGVPVLLVTHAPFLSDNSTRSLLSKWSVQFYDKFVGPTTLNKFFKIIIIAPWERTYLEKMGAKKEQLVYIPNGIMPAMFALPAGLEEHKVLYFGRVSPIKNLEVLVEAFALIKDKKAILEIVGPAEGDYLTKLKKLVKDKHLESRVVFTDAIYDMVKKIHKIDSGKIYVLPSLREGMPQTLIEAMARGKLVVGSNNEGNKALIEDGKNGFLFKTDDAVALAHLIDEGLSKPHKTIREQAKKDVQRFAWSTLIEDLLDLLAQAVRAHKK
jgi:glycosyltransferase involved in cell wall biosynthesis